MTAPTRDSSGGSPVDLVAVQADHALLDALGRTGAVPWGWRASQGNARFTEALLAWRRACAGRGGGDHEPLVDVDTALAVVASQTTPTGPLTPGVRSASPAPAGGLCAGGLRSGCPDGRCSDGWCSDRRSGGGARSGGRSGVLPRHRARLHPRRPWAR